MKKVLSAFEELVELVTEIQTEELVASHEIALRTCTVLEKIIAGQTWTTPRDLIDEIQKFTSYVIKNIPVDGVIATNMMKYIIRVIRTGLKGPPLPDSSDEYDDDDDDENAASGPPPVASDLRSRFLFFFSEYKTEVDTSIRNIANQSVDHIADNDVIFTFGRSNIVEEFLKHAAETKKFQVIVAEGAPKYGGHDLANELAEREIETSVISDAAMFAVMSKVTKVIVGTHSILADGGLRAPAGTLTMALSAKTYSVPFLVLSPQYKVTPQFFKSLDDENFNTFGPAGEVLPLSLGVELQANVINPRYDYVSPEYITMFIFHQGVTSPATIYRVLDELYHSDEYETPN